MIVQNKGGIGNPNHDEEGKFTTGDHIDKYMTEFEQDSNIAKKVFDLLGISDKDTFYNTMKNIEEKSPKKFEKIVEFLDNFIDKNREQKVETEKFEYKDLDSMTDEELDEEIKKHHKFFDENNIYYGEINNTKETGLIKDPFHNWSFWYNGFQRTRNTGKMTNYTPESFANKRCYVGFSRGIEESIKKFPEIFDKSDRISLSTVLGTSASGAYTSYMVGNKKCNIVIAATDIAKMVGTKKNSLISLNYSAGNGGEMPYLNFAKSIYTVGCGSHEMGHAYEYLLIKKQNPNVATNYNLLNKEYTKVANRILNMTINSYMEETGANKEEAIAEIRNSVSEYAKTKKTEWFAEVFGGIVAKKEVDYLPAERHLLKVLKDKDFINKVFNY